MSITLWNVVITVGIFVILLFMMLPCAHISYLRRPLPCTCDITWRWHVSLIKARGTCIVTVDVLVSAITIHKSFDRLD